MKKLLLVLAVAGAFAACGNKSGSDSDKKDSTATAPTTAPAADTTHKMDSSATKMMGTDSTKKN